MLALLAENPKAKHRLFDSYRKRRTKSVIGTLWRIMMRKLAGRWAANRKKEFDWSDSGRK